MRTLSIRFTSEISQLYVAEMKVSGKGRGKGRTELPDGLRCFAGPWGFTIMTWISKSGFVGYLEGDTGYCQSWE